MFDEKCKHHDECGYDFCHGEGVCEDFRGKANYYLARSAEGKLLWTQ